MENIKLADVRSYDEAAAERRAAGASWLASHQPAWAKAVIVAELRRDVSEPQSDYYNTTTDRTVLLAWSKHTRDLFAEMRRAAGRYDETAHLVNAGKEAEHREKWSMGQGYYLTETNGYSSGWRVRKWRLDWRASDLAKVAANVEARAPLA